MTSTLIRDFGGSCPGAPDLDERIDDAVRRILRVKFRAGLFEHPYAPFTPHRPRRRCCKPDAVAVARKEAARTMVLLRISSTLPLDPTKKTAVIGPLV